MPAGQPFTNLCRELARPLHAGRADLHLHTTASDGTYTPEEIVNLACRSGLSAIALTDHDTLAGVEPARGSAEGPLEIIAGVEISAEFEGRDLHLLGLFVRLDDRELNAALQDLCRQRIERFREMIEKLKKLGVSLESETDEGKPGTGALGRRHVAEMLVKAGRAGSVRQAFQRYLHDGGRASVPKRRIPVGHAIALVRGAGGVASWAHPNYDCTEEKLNVLRELGLNAVEADFPSCRPSRRRELRSLAGRMELAVSGGSDCHGPGMPHRAVGACAVTRGELELLRGRIQ